MGFKDKPGLKVFRGLDPVCPKCGPYEASEGIYPRQARKKLGLGRQFEYRKGESEKVMHK